MNFISLLCAVSLIFSFSPLAAESPVFNGETQETETLEVALEKELGQSQKAPTQETWKEKCWRLCTEKNLEALIIGGALIFIAYNVAYAYLYGSKTTYVPKPLCPSCGLDPDRVYYTASQCRTQFRPPLKKIIGKK